MRLNKAPKEKLKSKPRKVKFEDEWDSVVTNRRHGGEVGESRVRDNNMSSIKKKTPLNDPEEWHKLGKMMEAYIEFHMRGSEEPSLNASSCKSNHCKEEEKPTIFTPLSENKPKTDEIEEIEVMAKEGELWVEGVIPNLQEEADKEVLVDDVRAELKNDNVEHIEFIGVDLFDVHPNFMLLDFFNKLRRIMLQYGLNFKEFCFVRRIKRRRYLKYLFSWQGRIELSHVKFRRKNEKYSKYLFNWHGRFQVSKQCQNAEVVKDWLNRGMEHVEHVELINSIVLDLSINSPPIDCGVFDYTEVRASLSIGLRFPPSIFHVIPRF
ncbi:hypothetical protein LguiA_002298 [Lonicera macranthoides]